MLSLTDIKTAANELLKEATGLKIYGKEVTENYSTPSLFVEIISKPFRGKHEGFAKSGFGLKIVYLQTTPDEMKQLQMIDTVKAAFGMVFTVKDRHLTVGEITYDFIGEKENILQISVDFDFYENSTTSPAEEIAGEVEFILKK